MLQIQVIEIIIARQVILEQAANELIPTMEGHYYSRLKPNVVTTKHGQINISIFCLLRQANNISHAL